jgi:hypothetical protein
MKNRIMYKYLCSEIIWIKNCEKYKNIDDDDDGQDRDGTGA